MGHQRATTQGTPSNLLSTPAMSIKDAPESKPPACSKLLEDKLDSVLAAIKHSQMSLETKIDNVATDLTLQHVNHQKLIHWVSLVEQSLIDLQPKSQCMDTSIQTPLECIRVLEWRADDADGRSRRNNNDMGQDVMQ
ncbi:hypothetical protein NDU88_005709 [Pleurodeles waltl]|uniref:Uncharacterized protein n=1 Tax=Pleurodeles waltl TaxID=8319 RepID=A0AAV7RMU9_PLEWA|nr:hypothetical protein NDU88_005709 [Pleurodeles waltl]